MPQKLYDPERSITELRTALLDREDSFRTLNDSMVRAAAVAEGEHFADPYLREAAGLGAITAAATASSFAAPGGETMILNAVGMFGLALVDSARDELGTAGR
jgi:hypothetical protein